MGSQPVFYIIAGPNGAGKTTASMSFLPGLVGCEIFINADEIARGLSPLNPGNMALKSGRMMLELIKSNIEQKNTFAIETTLATKSYAHYIGAAKKNGYKVVLLFLWLDSEEKAIKRVEARVNEGGHDIPVAVIIRRYKSGLRNLKSIYHDISDELILIDNSGFEPQLVMHKDYGDTVITNHDIWRSIYEYEQ